MCSQIEFENAGGGVHQLNCDHKQWYFYTPLGGGNPPIETTPSRLSVFISVF